MKNRIFKIKSMTIMICFLIGTAIFQLHASDDHFNNDYAYPELKGDNAQYEWIENVQIGTINNSSGTNNGYYDYTSKNFNANTGETIRLKLTPGFSSGSYLEYWAVWVDFNQDSDFADSGEKVFSQSGKTAVSGSFDIPASALEGKTRVRIAMKYSSSPPSNGAGLFDYGEVEDYSVTITKNPGPEPTPVIHEDRSVTQVYQMIQGNPELLIIDVRRLSEYDQGHLENALLIDYYGSNFREELKKLDRSKAYVVYCKSGNRSKKAQGIMKELSFKETYNMLGGFTAWKNKGYPISYR